MSRNARATRLPTYQNDIAVVTTDMPLAHDAPIDIGGQLYCNSCRICAEACPIGAISPGDKVAFNGVKKWKLDEEKCYGKFQGAPRPGFIDPYGH